MQPRTLGSLAAALLLSSAVLAAQSAPPPGSAMPGPAAPRVQTPGTPPRDATGALVPTGSGRIRGRVTAVDSGNPLRRAQVVINATNVRLTQVVNTDAEGRYEAANLPAGRYTITVTRNGYVTLQFGQRRPFEPGKPLDLADGQVIEKIDFALPRGSVIAGRITDEFGEPLAGVRVQAQRYMYMPGGQRRLVSGYTGGGPFSLVTDDLGQFRVYGLMPGTYVLSATPTTNGMMNVTTTATGQVMATSTTGAAADANDGYATTYYPGTANVGEAQTIALGISEEGSASFSLIAAKMGRVSGFIRNSQGRPVVNGVAISLRTEVSGYFSTMTMNQAGADGGFSLANVPPGEHVIDVRPMFGRPGTAQQPADEEFGSVPITVAGQDISGLIITTGPGATLTGHVTFEGTSARPASASANTTTLLRVLPSPADVGAPFPMSANTPDNGVVDETARFQIRGVSGRVLFRTNPPPGWFLKSVMLNGVDITDIPYEAKPSTSVDGLEVVLIDRTTNLSGSVRNTRGETMKDYVAVIFPSDVKEGAVATRFTRTARPDQDGRYQIRGLPPGDYFAVAVESLDQGDEWDPAFQQQVKSKGKAFKLAEGQTMTLDLQLAQ